MGRKSLILVGLILSGCQSDKQAEKFSQSTQIAAVAVAQEDLPDLATSCTAHMGRATIKPDEPWVIHDKRWNILADNRDHLADNCAVWWETYRKTRKTGALK